ncbi:MAG TPA: ABC-2 transporter permease [Thermotogota bacterium]|nr:ABC-2 transporter permease [Thermotogota bacterium]
MLPLLKKDLREVTPFLIVMGALYAFTGVFFHTFASEAFIYPLILFRVLLFFPVIGIGEISMIESKEDRQRGYALLFALPITTIRLVCVKVFRSAAILLVLGILSWLADYSLYSQETFFLALTSVYLLIIAGILLFEILLYWGIYRFGYHLFFKVFWVLILSSLVLAQLFLFSDKTSLKSGLDAISLWLDRSDWHGPLALIVFLCYGCGFPNLFVPLLVFAGSAVMLEKNEERYKGYEILRRLPLKPQTVFVSRILFIFALSGIGLLGNFAFLLSKSNRLSNPGLPVGESFFMFSLTLFLLGILYPGILKKGYSAQSLWIWPSYFFLIVVGSISNTRLFTRYLPIPPEIFYDPYLWGILLIAASLFLFLRGPAAVRALQQRS